MNCTIKLLIKCPSGHFFVINVISSKVAGINHNMLTKKLRIEVDNGATLSLVI